MSKSITPEESRRALAELAALSLDPARACKNCANRTRAGNCGTPVEAGISERIGTYWPESDEWVMAKCKGFEPRLRRGS